MVSSEPDTRRDVIVIGGSAGAIEVLRTCVSRLPSDLPAAIFIVVHVFPGAESHLPHLLSRRSALPVRHARDGDEVQNGRILVAPPDHHMILRDGHVELNRGPTENSTRPAIDPLFRSAAEEFGARVCGVVLSGNLNDGSSGLRQIVRNGGVALVQDPAEALYPDMPTNAIAWVQDCRSVQAAELAPTLVAIAEGASTHSPPDRPLVRGPLPPTSVGEVLGADDAPGVPSGLTCPECHGALWIDDEAQGLSFHCRVGHRFTSEALEHLQRVEVEKAMWAAVRALREEASVARRIAISAEADRYQAMARRYREREEAATRHADMVEHLLVEEPPEALVQEKS